MKLYVEPNEDAWVVMVNDMLGIRRFNSLAFNSRDEALNYLKDTFKNDNDILNSIE